MRLPWIQIDDDAMTRGRTLARLLEIPEAHGIGLCVALWDWALDMAPEGDLRGRVADVSPATLCRAAVGWSGDAQLLWASYQRVGLVDDSGRVKGLKRYDKIIRKRHRDRERVAASRQRHVSESPRKTETETEKKDIAAKKPAADPRLKPLTDTLAVAFEAIRGEKYRHSGAKDATALKSLLPIATDEAIAARWTAGLRGSGWASCSTFAQLASKWNDLAAPGKPTQTEAPLRML